MSEEITEVLVEAGSGYGDNPPQDLSAQPQDDGSGSNGNDTAEPLPPELQALVDAKVKSFQADYTRKRKEESEALAKAQEKAQAFDRLITDAQYRQQFVGAFQGQQAAQGGQREPWMDLDPATFFDEPTHNAAQAAAYRVNQKILTPIVQELEGYKKLINEVILPFVQNYQQTSAQSEWKALEGKFQGAAQHKEAVDALRKQAPNLSYEQALYAVAGPSLRALGPGEKSPENKQRGTLFNGTTASANGRPASGKVDLVSLVSQALRRGGS